MRRLTLWCLLLACALPLLADTPQYEVYAIRYATLPQFPISALIKGGDPSVKIDVPCYIWLVRGGGKNILVDSGFYRPQFMKQWKPADYVRPDQAVANAGVKPEEITDVVVTHAHWDHLDGADLFPKAQIWIQRDEYVYYTADAWQSGGKHGGVDPDDVDFLLRANTQGRLHLVADQQEIIPGIRVYTGGRHTWASQYVTVAAKPGTIVLASDNVYLYENLEKHAPIAQTFDESSNLRAQDAMKSLASDARLIVPGHDPAVLKKFPEVGKGIVHIE